MGLQRIEEILVGRRTLEEGIAEARFETANAKILSAHRVQPPHHVA